MKNFILYLLSAVILFSSCAETESPAPGNNSTVSVEFTTTVSGTPFHAGNGGYTRAVDAHWTAGDQVGIFMYDHATAGAIDNNAILASNRKYTADADGKFTADMENMLLLGENDPLVDFFAYYPYRANQGTDYTVSLADQSDQEALDLLYAVTTSGYDAEKMPVALSFSHQLTKLVFNVTSDVEVSSFKAVIKNIVTQGSFDLYSGTLSTTGATTGDITLKSAVDGKSVTVEAIVFPQGDVSGKEIEFTVNGLSTTWTFPSGTNWETGKKTTYNVNITGGEAETELNYGWFETPAITNIENTVFLTYALPEAEYSHIRNYSMLYDQKYFVAYWVAYPMCLFYYGESAAPTNKKWHYDSSFSNSMQADVVSKSWPENSTKGYERGHQIASADRRYSTAANETTYVVTNQTPQHSGLNGGIWATLEAKVRDWMKQCDTVYVVTGAMITTKEDQTITYTPDNSDKQIAVPKYYYKALAKYTISPESYETIGFLMPHQDNLSGNILNYSLSVKDLEKETGFTFFPFLSDKIKSTVTASQWQ